MERVTAVLAKCQDLLQYLNGRLNHSLQFAMNPLWIQTNKPNSLFLLQANLTGGCSVFMTPLPQERIPRWIASPARDDCIADAA